MQIKSFSLFKTMIPAKTSKEELEILKQNILFSNMERVWVTLFAGVLSGIFFLIARYYTYSSHGHKSSHNIYIALNIALITSASILLWLFNKYKIKTPQEMLKIHTVLTYTAITTLVFFVSISAGVELVYSSTFSRGIATIFVLCILFTIKWWHLLCYFGFGAISTGATIFILGDNLSQHAYNQLHLPIIMFFSWFISRALYVSFVRDFFVRKELENTNNRLKDEISGRLSALEELKISNESLENRVLNRTANLQKANELLKQEIAEHTRTESVLQQTEAQSRALIEKMNDGFAVFSEDLKVTYANDKLCEMIGISWHEIINKNMMDFIPEESWPVITEQVSLRKKGARESYELTLKNLSGNEINVIVSPEPLYDESNKIIGSFSVITDITKMKKMELALRRSEEMSRALLDASSDAVMMLQPDGKILVANEMVASKLAVEPKHLSGKNIFNFFGKETILKRREKLNLAKETKKPVFYEDELNGFFYALHIYPINDGDNEIKRLAVFARDITELKIAEDYIHNLSQELIIVQENERQRISRDLHDNVAQDLATLKIGCDTLFNDTPDQSRSLIRKVEGFSRILQRTIMSIRNLAYDLRPPGLDQLGIVSTISRYCDDFSDRHMISVDFYSAGVSELSLKPDAEINLYRLVQEALNNVNKHAEASHVTIRLISSFPTIILRIEDDGIGFNIKKRREESHVEKRMGIRSMEERAAILKGELQFNSREAHGTKIIVEIPHDYNVNHNPENIIAD